MLYVMVFQLVPAPHVNGPSLALVPALSIMATHYEDIYASLYKKDIIRHATGKWMHLMACRWGVTDIHVSTVKNHFQIWSSRVFSFKLLKRKDQE